MCPEKYVLVKKMFTNGLNEPESKKRVHGLEKQWLSGKKFRVQRPIKKVMLRMLCEMWGPTPINFLEKGVTPLEKFSLFIEYTQTHTQTHTHTYIYIYIYKLIITK